MEGMLSLLLIPATFITVAYFYQSNGMSDKKKLQRFLKLQRYVFNIKVNYNTPFL